MAGRWIESLAGSLEEKRQYRRDVTRTEALPEPYRATVKAFQRYLMYCGGKVERPLPPALERGAPATARLRAVRL